MTSTRESVNGMRISLTGAAIFTLLTVSLVAAPTQAGRRRVGPIALNSVTENGPIVQLELGDGTKVDVARSDIRISDESRATAMRNEHKGGKKNRASASSTGSADRVKPSVAQLSRMSATSSRLPAVARIVYGSDGYVKRVRIRLFATEADASAFLAGARERKSAARSQAPQLNQ